MTKNCKEENKILDAGLDGQMFAGIVTGAQEHNDARMQVRGLDKPPKGSDDEEES